eukprot:Tbor_TRINITY_DN5895_c0_g1::TRINITY_DN5895_c0_g1_i10::g.7100::m.7100
MGTGCVVSNVSIILLISIRYGKKTYSSHASGLTWTMVLSLRAQAKTVWNSNSFFPIIAEAYRHTPRIVATCLVVRIAVLRMSFSVLNFPRVFEDRVFSPHDNRYSTPCRKKGGVASGVIGSRKIFINVINKISDQFILLFINNKVQK